MSLCFIEDCVSLFYHMAHLICKSFIGYTCTSSIASPAVLFDLCTVKINLYKKNNLPCSVDISTRKMVYIVYHNIFPLSLFFYMEYFAVTY